MGIIKLINKTIVVVLGLITFLVNHTFAQEGLYKINWTENGKQVINYEDETIVRYYLKFEGASYNNEELIPAYYKSIKLPTGNRKKFQLDSLKYEIVPDSIIDEVEMPGIFTEKEPVVAIYRSVDQQYLDVSLIPLRQNDKGEWERLVQFEVTSTEGDSISEYSGHIKKDAKIVSNSLLETGHWYKIKVKSTGIYKLSYSELDAMGFSNLSDIRIFGHGGRQLSYKNADPRPIDMVECPVYMHKGSDNIFNSGDYILFYAEGPLTWDYDEDDGKFRQEWHGYSNAIYYFLTTDHGEAKGIEQHSWQDQSEDEVVNTYNNYAYLERNLLNLIKSGRTWYTRRIETEPVDTTFRFSNISTNAEVNVEAKVAGRSSGTGRNVYLKINDVDVQNKYIDYVSFAFSYNTYAKIAVFDYTFNTSDEEFGVGVEYERKDLNDRAFIDYITVNANCDLINTGYPFFFRNVDVIGAGAIVRYDISDVSGNVQVWDITDINNVFAVEGNLSGDTFSFKAPADELREYVLVKIADDYPKPYTSDSEKDVGEIENQNLRGYATHNYIIVAPEVFLSEAERLAEYHRQYSNLSVLVVTPQQIYNEFSSGTPDVSAIRDFVRYQYKNGSGATSLKYLLLFGDGSYNNHMNKEGNTNYILTYQSRNSVEPINSFVTDDFFGQLDDEEGLMIDESGNAIGKLDIGVGRLPVKAINNSIAEATDVVDKLISYHEFEYSDWRKTLCFMGDDGFDGSYNDGVIHMEDADKLAGIVDDNNDGFRLKKIYLDAYPQVTSSAGPTYPEAKAELMDAINKGLLLVSYNGHGSENGITGEKVFHTPDIVALENKDKLPLFITATCEFSRYDDVAMEGNSINEKTSAGEHVLLNPNGGGIGLFTTTRAVSRGGNYLLAAQVFQNIFSKMESGQRKRIGDVVKDAKNAVGNSSNKLNFSLLGDPALMLAYPEFKVITDSINGNPVGSVNDTLKAFNEVNVTGYVAYDDSTMIEDFNGYIYPHVFDKAVPITTLGNDDQVPFNFMDQSNLIFSGKASVKNGRFSFNFIVPKDISYNYGLGKISYYAENQSIDAKGEYDKVYIGGTGNVEITDFEGPEIRLFMNDTNFTDGDMTSESPYLYARLTDENGINTTGIGIGHDIVAEVDYDYMNAYILNDYYEAEVDNHRAGNVRYQIRDLENGEHTLSLKAWDIYNNSSEEYIGFVVEQSDDVVVRKLLNFPNPANDFTRFQYYHNQPGEDHNVLLQVFDLSGRLVYSHEYTNFEQGFISTPITWDLRTDGGSSLKQGVYPYRIRVKTSAGTIFINQKLIILR